MKKSVFVVALALSGCFATTPKNQFAVKDYEFSSLNSNPTVKEMRVFTAESSKCAFEKTPESGTALSIVLGFAAEQAVKYVSAKLEERAKYLKSDLTLSAMTNLAEPWPTDAAAPVDGIKRSRNNLCVLLVAGEFASASPPNNQPILFNERQDVMDSIMSAVYGTDNAGSALTVFGEYRHFKAGVPTVKNSPFDGLIGKPSLIAEFRIVSGKSEDKVISYILPTFLLYPHPLHESTVNGPERPFRVTFGFNNSESTLVMDKYKSGQIYTDDMMKTTMGELVTEANKKAVSLKVTVVEGPDGLQTAQILEDIAAKKDDVTKYAVDKVAELAEGKGKAEEAAKK